MRIGFVLALAASLALGGCLSAKQREATAAANQADADCKAQPFKTAVALAECRNNAMRLAMPATSAANRDLLELGLAQRMVLAEKVDRHQITQAEADLEMAKMKTTLVSTEQNRIAAARAAQGTTCTTQWVFNTVQTVCD